MKIPNVLGANKSQQTIMGKSKGYMNSVIKKVKGTDKQGRSINQVVKDRNQEYHQAKKIANSPKPKGNKIDTKA